MHIYWAPQVVLLVQNLPAKEGDIKDMDLIPGLRRSPGEGHGNPLQCLWLEIPMDRGSWQAVVHTVAECLTWLKQLSMHAHIMCIYIYTYITELQCCTSETNTTL